MIKFLNYLFLIAISILLPEKLALGGGICDSRPYGVRVPYLEGNCSSFAVCAFEKIAYISECPKGLHFNRRLSECDLPSRAGCEKFDECIPNYCELCDCEECCGHGGNCTNEICKNKDDGTKLPIDGDCRKYIVCKNECPTIKKCKEGWYFNPEEKECQRNVCEGKSNGTNLPIEGDCKNYINCQNECPTQLKCKNGWYFNPKTGKCDLTDDPCAVPTPPSTGPSGISCPEKGKCVGKEDGVLLSHPTSLCKFIICQCECDLERPCPPGTEFNEKQRTCVHSKVC